MADRWRTLHGRGKRDLLSQRSLGLICSVQCPGSVVSRTFDAMRELRDAGIMVAGGFHSPMEKECLGFLFRGDQPVILCAARGIDKARMPPAWRERIDAGRLAVVSPFGGAVGRPTSAQAQTRNELIAALSVAVFVPYASPGGKTETIARSIVQRGQVLFTLEDTTNTWMVDLGARLYELDVLREVLETSGKGRRAFQ